MLHAGKQVRRKSAWRSKNCGRAARFATMRAAKERKRIERASREEALPTLVRAPRVRVKPLFTVRIRCRDGAWVCCQVFDGPFGLTPSAALVARKVACVLRHYRPMGQYTSLQQ